MGETKRMILYGHKNNRPYFVFNKVKRFLEDISSEGYDLTCFTNCGYFGGFRLTGFENGINDFAVLEVV